MKKLFFIFFLFPSFVCFAQETVVERSGRKPGWVNGPANDFIIVMGTGASVNDAQRNALNLVKESIIDVVAQNVKTTSEMVIEEAIRKSSVTVFLEKFATTVSGTSGPIPYLQGVSLSKVEEFYWEKLQRGSSAVFFNYYAKYPFPDTELQKLVVDFNIRDQKLTEQLDQLLANIDSIGVIEDIERNITELRILSDYFIDTRQDKAKAGIARYRRLYSGIELVELESGLGELKFALQLGNRLVSTIQRPQITSDCARVSGTSIKENHILIQYDYSNCSEDSENNILVRYRFGNTNVQKSFFFDITTN
jgi:hypothetical protein